MGTCVHFSRSLPSNSWWQTMVGWQVLSRPSAAEGGGRRPAFTGLATQPYSATEVDGWQHKLSRVSQNRAAVHLTVSGNTSAAQARSYMHHPRAVRTIQRCTGTVVSIRPAPQADRVRRSRPIRRLPLGARLANSTAEGQRFCLPGNPAGVPARRPAKLVDQRH
jgi:hypothetical protein